jgi:CAAX prenyl protease-like protein
MLRPQPSAIRDLAEVIFGYGLILVVLRTPDWLQRILSPVALLATLAVLLVPRPSRDELGLGGRGLVPSLWILPAAIALSAAGILIARRLGTLHPLSDRTLWHVVGYVLWTVYQQILLQDYFLTRLLRIFRSETASITMAALLFAAAHLPNLVLTAATLVWGAVSCLLFHRYRNLYVLGLAQGLLGLCFAVCVPDALHHHMRVGLGYLHYQAMHRTP